MKAIAILLAALLVITAILIVSLRLARATRLWPAGLLIVTAPLEVYRSSSGAGLNLSLFRLALVAGVAALAIDVFRGNKRLARRVPLPFAVYGALLLWQFASLVLVTPNHSLAYRFFGQYAGGMVAALVIVSYVRRSDLRVVAALYGGGVLLPLLAATYRVFSVRHGGSGDLPGLSSLPLDPTIEAARQTGSYLLDGTQRLNATFSDPNHFGFYVSTVFVVVAGAAAGRLLRPGGGSPIALACYCLLAVCCAIAIVGTYSRSSWLLAGLGAAIAVALLGRGIWTRRRVIVASSSLVVALAVASPVILSRLGSSERGNAESTRVHEHTMSIALKLLAHHPLIGVGLGDYGRHAGQPTLISSSHSTFLTVAAELGAPGMLLLLGAIITAIVPAVAGTRRAVLPDRAVLAGLTASYTALAAANILYEVWMDDFQWVLFGLLLALAGYARVPLPVV